MAERTLLWILAIVGLIVLIAILMRRNLLAVNTTTNTSIPPANTTVVNPTRVTERVYVRPVSSGGISFIDENGRTVILSRKGTCHYKKTAEDTEVFTDGMRGSDGKCYYINELGKVSRGVEITYMDETQESTSNSTAREVRNLNIDRDSCIAFGGVYDTEGQTCIIDSPTVVRTPAGNPPVGTRVVVRRGSSQKDCDLFGGVFVERTGTCYINVPNQIRR